ncbi:MAG: chitobiase/beta-hexosaminidase C-terminal domain-containing protein [Methanolobus sp.]|uniref:chitobiase/beta-hexosaminidase C-terminal domain-containing protein n=1 Tax=Methanolobus sp. TaxID=1874737 RepID=UPI0027310CFC|nr:chitobiase/beta-hexosaminidase C-terminal domain-containing protein [Methanolobus sp.]MDP2216395.1 chitobiase/beta-hexosaminidase C-terminal domain-containing protein [Methanolobus sp.]
MKNKHSFNEKRHKQLLLVFLVLLMSALVILPSGCLDKDTYDQQVDATESHTPDAGKDEVPEIIDVSNVTDEPQPAEEPVVQTITASTSGRSGSSGSSSPSPSPHVSRSLTGSDDYTEPTGTITGDLTITGDITGTITLPVGLTVNGNLNVNTPGATVTNRANVGGTINIIAVSVNTWNQYGNANGIQMGATNATFFFFSGNITQGLNLIAPCNVVIGVNATGLPFITVTEDAEGSDIDNLGSEELNLTTQANVTVAGNVNATEADGYNVTVNERVSTPIANPTAGTYVGTQNITLTTATGGATIRYTIDGNEPTNVSTAYADPIEVAADMTIKAIGVKEGLDNSEVTEFAYVITILPSTDADLSAVTVTFGTLDPVFDADTTAYTVDVDYDVTTINVTATLSDSAASMEINGEEATSAEAVAVTLEGPGESTEIVISVTAEDTTTVKNYTITVNRDSVPDIQSAGVGITQGSAVFGYEFFSDVNGTVPITYNNATIAPYYLNTTASTVRLERGSNATEDIPVGDLGIGEDGTVTYENLTEVEAAFGNPGFVNNWGGAPTHIVLNLTGGQGEYVWTFDTVIEFVQSDMDAFGSLMSQASQDLASVASAKIAIDAADYTNLVVDDTNNQTQKTAAVQAAVTTAVDDVTVTATVSWNAGTSEYDVAISKNAASDTTSITTATFVLSQASQDLASVASAKIAIDAADYTNLVVDDTNNQTQKTAAVQAAVTTAVDDVTVTATVSWNAGTSEYDVAISKNAASDTTSITTATFVLS